jgi:hypothetical protein
MQPLQDWCLQCGAGQPGSLGHGAGWRAGAAALGAVAVLVAGAGVAAYAALGKHSHKPRTTLALRPGAVPPAGTPVTPGGSTPGGATTAPGGATTAPGGAPGLPNTIKATPPKIPLQTPTPKSSGGSEASANSLLFPPSGKQTKAASKATKSGGAGKATGQRKGSPAGGGQAGEEGGGSGGGEGGSGGGEQSNPILLDTNAAATYNPYGYPATMFGDPSLAIDGEASTAWTARVDPAKAPAMAEGLVLDLKSALKLGSAKVTTSSKGMTVEIYGANGAEPPPTITDPGWKRLSGSKTLSKKATTLKLKAAGAAYRFVVLWLNRAPARATSVAVDELELFPASG